MKPYHKTSKLPVTGDSISRPRIDALLQEGIKFPAVVVAAGAGFGKTQAVANFLEHSDYRGVWMQLTFLDNLPMRFWESFVYTVSTHKPAMAEKLQELGFPDSIYKFNKFLQLFTEDLYADNQFVVFVFDDFQIIEDEAVARFFINFVAANLENICILFITRKLESYSFNTRVYIITTDDLRFTEEETMQYFESRDIKIESDEERERIYAYTGGWPMALYLVSLQIKKRNLGGEERLIHSQQMIFKLIEKEIFANYTAAEQKFFAILSELNFFPKPLLLEVGKYVGVDAETLLQDNVLIAYDEKAKSFYLHQVFLDYLADKRYLFAAELKDNMLCRAGDWCVDNNYFADAIDYYYRCGREDKVWNVIRGFDGKRHTRDETDLFVKYIEKFSDAFLRENPDCQIVYAMLLFDSLRVDEALTQMAQVHRQLDGETGMPGNSLMKGEACFGSGLIELRLGDAGFVHNFKEAADLLPEGSRLWGSKLELVEYSNALNLSSPRKGEVERSIARFFEAMPYVYSVLHGVGYGLEYLAAAEGHFLMGNLKEADGHAHKAIYMAQEKDQKDILDNALFLLLRIYLVTGETRHIGDILKGLQANEREDEITLQGVSDIALGWFYSEIGEVQKVAGWILFSEKNNHPPISVDKDALLQIRCLIEEKNYTKALALSGRLANIYQKRNTFISRIYLYVYSAISHYALDNPADAAEALKQAYDLAKGDNLVMPFVEYGHRTRSMLDYFRKQGIKGIPGDWLETVHTKAATYAKRHAYIASQFRDSGMEAKNFGLTRREIELLHNMSIGLTRDEIAQSMYISPNTVKSMLKTVYNKIGAINSADAVRIAMGAGLL